MSEFIEYKDITEKGMKTVRLQVLNKKTGVDLGTIGWHGAWRRYVFIPEHDTFFDYGCMVDVVKKISELMDAREVLREQG